MDPSLRVSANKTFFESKTMKAALICSAMCLSVLFSAFIGAILGPKDAAGNPVFSADLLQLVTMIFGGTFAAIWPLAIGGHKAVEFGEVKWAGSISSQVAAAAAVSQSIGSKAKPPVNEP
jgi:hypothetical protein